MDYKRKLRECRTCAEAAPILETVRATPSQRKLIETAIQLKSSRDPRQQSYGEDFMLTAIREMEDCEHGTKEQTIANMDVGKGKDDAEKAVHEADTITGSLDSNQSSDIDMPYPKEGSDAPNSDIESMQTASGENQMGGIKEMPMPGQMGGMPPAPGMPPMAPDVMKQLAPQQPPMPPMNTGQQMRQMQYTVEANMRKYFNPMVREIKRQREAILALNHKVQETQSLSGSMKLDIDKVKKNSPVRERLRETVGDMDIPVPSMNHNRFDLEKKRQDITSLDRELGKGTIYQ